MTNTPEQTLSDLLALGEKLTPGPWLRDESDTNPGRPAVFADGGITGVAQVAIFPREFTAATENADFLADAKNALPALRSLMEEVKGLREAAERLKEMEAAVGEYLNTVGTAAPSSLRDRALVRLRSLVEEGE